MAGSAHAMVNTYPALGPGLFDSGKLVRHLVVFVDDVDIRTLAGSESELTSSSEITILLPVAGGNQIESNRASLRQIDVQRFGRQLLLDWMSGAAQLRFGETCVVLDVVAGDPASHWAAIYLLRAGIGAIELRVDQAATISKRDYPSPLLLSGDFGCDLEQALKQRLVASQPLREQHIANLKRVEVAIASADHGERALWRGSHAAAALLRSLAVL